MPHASAFTVRHQGRVNVLKTPVKVAASFNPQEPPLQNELKRESTKIIFAEDSKLIRTTMTSILKKAGFNITVFENGKDVFKHITSLKKRQKKTEKI